MSNFDRSPHAMLAEMAARRPGQRMAFDHQLYGRRGIRFWRLKRRVFQVLAALNAAQIDVQASVVHDPYKGWRWLFQNRYLIFVVGTASALQTYVHLLERDHGHRH